MVLPLRKPYALTLAEAKAAVPAPTPAGAAEPSRCVTLTCTDSGWLSARRTVMFCTCEPLLPVSSRRLLWLLHAVGRRTPFVNRDRHT